MQDIADWARITLGLSRFQWFRRWYGGRWERHFIDICSARLWLPMNRAHCWPKYRQPCSVGAPLVEDYPDRFTT